MLLRVKGLKATILSKLISALALNTNVKGKIIKKGMMYHRRICEPYLIENNVKMFVAREEWREDNSVVAVAVAWGARMLAHGQLAQRQ